MHLKMASELVISKRKGISDSEFAANRGHVKLRKTSISDQSWLEINKPSKGLRFRSDNALDLPRIRM